MVLGEVPAEIDLGIRFQPCRSYLLKAFSQQRDTVSGHWWFSGTFIVMLVKRLPEISGVVQTPKTPPSYGPDAKQPRCRSV